MQKRPLGITILSILSILSGLGVLILQILYNETLVQLMNEFEFSSMILVISVTFLALTSLISGVGMFLGKKWGWWLGAFCIIYAIIRNANALISIFNMTDYIESSTKGLKYYLTKHIGRIITNGLVFTYFFKNNVMEYFRIKHYSKYKVALQLIVTGICIFILFAFTFSTLNR